MAAKKPSAEPLHVVGAAIIDDRGRCLAAQRGTTLSSAGRWELPGGKVEAGEAPAAALAREIREELGIEIAVGELIGRGTAEGTRHRVVLDVYAATAISGRMALREHAAVRWLAPEELESVDWADADRPVLPALRLLLEARAASGSRLP